jgi:signal transduction histidine kinase
VRRLYLSVYATVLGVLVLFALLAGLAWWVAGPGPHEPHLAEGVARLAADLLPLPGAPEAETRAALARIGDALLAEVTLYAADGARVAAVGEPVPRPRPGEPPPRFGRGPGRRGMVLHLELPDGRQLFLRHPHRHAPLRDLALGGLLLTLAVGLGAWPLARRTTRRLERLQARVDALGAGDLAARVEVEGRDEVAELARSFNRAADRIERLVDAQRTVLAGASHELRTPLARIRMAAELLAGDARPELRERIERDIAELDELIGELLLASRLDSPDALEAREEVDLLALAAEEAARTGAAVGGEPVTLSGDARLLRRLVRNLLENARRHAGAAAVEVTVAREGDRVRLRVDDAGPGVPESERERIFEPFHRRPGARAESSGGAGLGLALVRRIARRHGGDVRCLPRPGGGSRFDVELPLPPPSPANR